jgi:antitoxin VapB
MLLQRRARLFKNGRNQSVRIPREFEMPGSEVLIFREGDRLVLAPVKRQTLREVLESLETLPKAERFPDFDDPIPESVEL